MTIDLRSDTFTKPTAGMMDAMRGARVGDDVFGEDTSVNELASAVLNVYFHIGTIDATFAPAQKIPKNSLDI